MELRRDFGLEYQGYIIVVRMDVFCVFYDVFCDVWGAIFFDYEDVAGW
jgi:hypothetical protein